MSSELNVAASIALAQSLGNQAEQHFADLFLQKISQVALLAQVLYLTQQVAVLGAQAALTGMALAANQVALEAQATKQLAPKQPENSCAASVARFGLMGFSDRSAEQRPRSFSPASK